MRLLMYLALIAVGIAAAFWVMQSRQDSRRRGTLGGAAHVGAASATPFPAEGPAGGDISPVQLRSHARLLYGPEASPGWLTLYPSQLVFTAQSGRVAVTERMDIHGVTSSHDLPDRTVARPALVVATTAETFYFEVDDPVAWVNALL